MGRLLASRVGPQDVGGTPAEATQFSKQSLLADAGGKYTGWASGVVEALAIVMQRDEPAPGHLYLVGTPIGCPPTSHHVLRRF